MLTTRPSHAVSQRRQPAFQVTRDPAQDRPLALVMSAELCVTRWILGGRRNAYSPEFKCEEIAECGGEGRCFGGKGRCFMGPTPLSCIITRWDLEDLEPDAFEAFCAILWSKLGYARTVRTPHRGDGGVDVVAISGKTGVLIQCKSSSVDGRELG